MSKNKNRLVDLRIGNIIPNSNENSASLQLDDTNSGFLPNRLTTIQRNEIQNPANGLLIYNTDNSKLEIFNGSVWLEVGPNETGTYLPIGTNITNIHTLTLSNLNWSKNQNIVNVFGKLELIMSNAFSEFRLTLPINSNFNDYGDLSGTFICHGQTYSFMYPGMVEADIINNQAFFKIAIDGNSSPEQNLTRYSVNFSYIIN